ncbi:MAG: SDR family oxidoreductase [Cyanobacteria bacterium P01_D01_bin.105]
MTHIFLAGASRGVGREMAKRLIIANYEVTALLRHQTHNQISVDELTAMGVNVVRGDALNADEMKGAVAAASPDAVISSIGGLPNDSGTRPDFEGNKNLIDAAIASGTNRYILISSIGSGNSACALPPQALETLGSVLKEKAQAEAYLATSSLTYTVIRPGGLISQPATDQEVLTADPSVSGSIPRPGVAKLAVACLSSDRAHNQIFSAVDRSMLRSEKEFDVVEL